LALRLRAAPARTSVPTAATIRTPSGFRAMWLLR
jgi:hypothetical protein